MEIKIFDRQTNYKNIINMHLQWEIILNLHLKDKTNFSSLIELQFILRNLSVIFFPDELCNAVMCILITLITIDKMDNTLINIKDNLRVIEWVELWARNIIKEKLEVEKSISRFIGSSFADCFIKFNKVSDINFEIVTIISNDGIYNIYRNNDIFFAIRFVNSDGSIYNPLKNKKFRCFLQIGGRYEFPYSFDENDSLIINGDKYYYNDTLRIIPLCLLLYHEVKVVFKKELDEIDKDFPCLKTLNGYIMDATIRRICLEKSALLNMVYNEYGIYQCSGGTIMKK